MGRMRSKAGISFACTDLPVGRRKAASSGYLNLLSGQKSTFAPSGKKLNWLEKQLSSFRMGTTSSTTMQHFRPSAGTRCTDSREIWYSQGENPLGRAKFCSNRFTGPGTRPQKAKIPIFFVNSRSEGMNPFTDFYNGW